MQRLLSMRQNVGPGTPWTRADHVWYRRIRARRITTRKLSIYTGVIAVIYFSDPWAATFALGCVLLLLAGVLRIWTFGHLRKNQTMITTGPYAHTRNPAYLGSLLALVGLGLAAGNPFTLSGQVVWGGCSVFVLIFFVRYLPRKYAREYPRLQKLFPEQYPDHAAHVPDFFPRLRPWRSGDRRRFSWRCVRDNHELFWPALVVSGVAIIWFF